MFCKKMTQGSRNWCSWSIALAFMLGLGALAQPMFAQTGVLYVEGNNVGIGTDTPATKLHVKAADGSASILVDDSAATPTNRTLFELRNAGAVQFFFRNTDNGQTWQMSAFPSTLQFGLTTTTGPKFRVLSSGGISVLLGSNTLMGLNNTGDLQIAGTLSQGSSRTIKTAIEPADNSKILDRVAELPIAEWSYKANDPSIRHIGPMAEDFHSVFGFGTDGQHLAPGDMAGVALASIQSLNRRLQEETAKRAELEKENQDLAQRLQALEAKVQKLTASSAEAGN